MKRIAALFFVLIALFTCSAIAEQEEPGYSRLMPAGVGQPVTCTFVQDGVEYRLTVELKYTLRSTAAKAGMYIADFDFASDFEMYAGDDFSYSVFEVSCECDDPNASLQMKYYDFDAFSADGQMFEHIFVAPNRKTSPTIYSGGTCLFHLAIPVPEDKKVGIVFDEQLWFFDDTQKLLEDLKGEL